TLRRRDTSCQRKFRKSCKKFVTWLASRTCSASPAKSVEFCPNSDAGIVEKDAAEFCCTPKTFLTFTAISSALKIGAEHVRSVHKYAAGRCTAGYWTSGFGNFPSRVS